MGHRSYYYSAQNLVFRTVTRPVLCSMLFDEVFYYTSALAWDFFFEKLGTSSLLGLRSSNSYQSLYVYSLLCIFTLPSFSRLSLVPMRIILFWVSLVKRSQVLLTSCCTILSSWMGMGGASATTSLSRSADFFLSLFLRLALLSLRFWSCWLTILSISFSFSSCFCLPLDRSFLNLFMLLSTSSMIRICSSIFMFLSFSLRCSSLPAPFLVLMRWFWRTSALASSAMRLISISSSSLTPIMPLTVSLMLLFWVAVSFSRMRMTSGRESTSRILSMKKSLKAWLCMPSTNLTQSETISFSSSSVRQCE